MWGRIVEAAAVVQSRPDREGVLLNGGAGTWPIFVRRLVDAYGWEGDPFGFYKSRAPRPAAWSSGAIDRMNETLTWLGWVRPQDMRVAFLLAAGWRAPQILRAVERFEHKRIRRQALYERKAAVLRRIVARLRAEGRAIAPAE